jgi:hypothetical protein
MQKLAIAVLAAVVATVGLAVDASAGNDGRGGDDRYLGPGYDYGGYYGGYDGYYSGYRVRRHWRRAYYAPRYVVRRNYYGGGCYRPKVDAWGNVYYKVRRACRW